ncbi:hypothetical protein FPV67DRAFT_1722058 [Lyophyllum atratum]|nr:hypothetical protein FPV67DRAFT_1722058 [Lyophyllum atratum]
MSIIFIPALVDTLHVTVPIDFISRNPTTAVLNFTATLRAADHDQLGRKGGRVQLWSNIPIDGATGSPGEWASCDFEESTTTGSEASASTTEVRLGDAGQDDTESSEQKVLSLQLCVPIATNGQSRFAFTYRLVYPSGEIRWLGEFGKNGALVLERVGRDPGLVLAEGWVPGEGGFVWTAAGEAALKYSAVIRLVNPAEYAIWTLGGNSTGKSPLAVLVPRLEPCSVYIPQAYVLYGSLDAAVSVPSEGIISSSGAGSLLLKPLPRGQPGLGLLAKHIVAHCSSDRVQVATLDEDAEHLIVASKGTYPIHGIVIPSAPRRANQGPSRLTISLDTLCALLPPHTTTFTLFSPRTRDIHFFNTSTESSFHLSPVDDLKAGECQVSILSGYTSALSENALPTPPASPQLRPIAHLTSSGRMPGGSATSSLSGSVLSLLDNNASVRDKGRVKEAGKNEEADEDITSSDRQLIVRPREPLLARLRLVCSVVFFILTMALKLLFGKLDSIHEDDEKESVADVDGTVIDEKQGVRSTDADGDDATSAAPLPQAAADAPVSKSEEEVLSLIAEISGGTVIIASCFTSAAMDGAGGGLRIEMNGQNLEVEKTQVGGGVSLLEFDGGGGGMVKISYKT